MLEKELNYSDKLLEVIYNCQMCGGCDISCKYAMDMEVLDPINEIRIECVESGHTLPIFDQMVSSLRKQGSMVLDAKIGRDAWYEGLEVKDHTKHKAQVIYHAGCRTAFDPEMWKVARSMHLPIEKSWSRYRDCWSKGEVLRRPSLPDGLQGGFPTASRIQHEVD